ncbi:MAG: hypothetical protein NC081_02010 [Roseburia sp.]|nr:hypothetical protein [Roseburia sp.]
MTKRVRGTCLGILIAVMLLGSSLTVFAANCSHTFDTTRTYHHSVKTGDHHEHTKIVDGKEYRYGCTTYIYYYEVTKKCSKCGQVYVLSGYETSNVCVPD